MMDNRHVAAADFKANCLRLMDEVARQRRPIIITKRGKPVAKLVPVENSPIDPLGCMAGPAMPATFESRPLLLDTHVWFWLVLGSAALCSAARKTISGAASTGNLRIA